MKEIPIDIIASDGRLKKNYKCPYCDYIFDRGMRIVDVEKAILDCKKDVYRYGND